MNSNTVYYIRGYTTNCNGTKIYGNQIQVTTLPIYTSIVTNATNQITSGTAVLNASVIANGQDYLYYGICYSTSQNPTIENRAIYFSATTSSTSFSRTIQGLAAGTTYYVRVFVHGGTSVECIGINYGNQVSFTTTSGPLVLGQMYQGGIIVKLNSPTTGIIAAATDQGNAAWGCEGTTINGTSAASGTGQANTTAIVSGCVTQGTAAKICDALVLNGKSDWFLPSEQELLLLSEITFFNNNNLETNGIASLNYWTSSQNSATQAKIVNNYTSGNINKSDNSIKVRAFRYF